VLARFALLAALVAGAIPAVASQGLQIHVTVAAAVAADASHARTLREAMTQAIAKRQLPARYTVDVSLMTLDVVAAAGNEVEATVEVRAALSDEKGVVRSVSAAKTKARGPARDRALIERDAISEGARALAKRLAP